MKKTLYTRTREKQNKNIYRLGHICFVSVSADRHAVEEEPVRRVPSKKNSFVFILNANLTYNIFVKRKIQPLGLTTRSKDKMSILLSAVIDEVG